MAMAPPLSLVNEQDPLALDPDWTCPVALTPLQQALETTLFRSGLSRGDWLKRLAGQLHRPGLLPLLWLLPRGWRLAPAQLPPRLQALAGVLEEGLLSPSLLAAVVDDLPHLLPPAPQAGNALELWCRTGLRLEGEELTLPRDAAALDARISASTADGIDNGSGTSTVNNALQETNLARPAEAPPADSTPSLASQDPHPKGPPSPGPNDNLSGGLIWRNLGLHHSQGPQRRRANALMAQLLNRLAANQLQPDDPWRFEDCNSGRDAINALLARGWRAEARLRASVASFGLGACLSDEAGGWRQVPIGLPLRTGLCSADGSEIQGLLPHTALELRLENPAGELLLLQYYQGTEGLCGWEGLNDLHRPWQNDRDNGTVRYMGEPFRGERLLELIELSEAMALVHNNLASGLGLRYGGYGCLGFCIDTTALLQQAMNGRTDLFPVLLSGIWRERLTRMARDLQERLALQPGGCGLQSGHERALTRYLEALETLPLDLSHHGASCADAWRRLTACQPSRSPFRLVQQFQAQAETAAETA